jgi:DNA-binding NarL/FixJ family response regulator
MALGITTTVNIAGAVGSDASGTSILVVDAHELIATSLAIALRHAGFDRVTSVDPDAVTCNGADALAPATGDIALVGLLFGDGRTTLALIRPLVERGWRVIVMASDQALPLAADCLDRGAEAVVDKGMSFERLVGTLRRLISGDSAMTKEEREALLEAVERHQQAEKALKRPFEALTEREADVLAALVSGNAPKQIAHSNGITVSTVRGHIQRVLAKLDVCSQREALAMARHAGWPSVEPLG